jgi:sec-independent protein translocase protein TatB
MMKRMSFSETVFLFVLALIIFGPKKLPEIARQVGKYMNEFRRASNEFKAQLEQEISHLDIEEKKRTILAPSPTPTGTASRTPALLSESRPAEAPPISNETSPATAVAAPAPSEDEPLFAAAGNGSAASAKQGLPDDKAASSTSQESHA